MGFFSIFAIPIILSSSFAFSSLPLLNPFLPSRHPLTSFLSLPSPSSSPDPLTSISSPSSVHLRHKSYQTDPHQMTNYQP